MLVHLGFPTVGHGVGHGEMLRHVRGNGSLLLRRSYMYLPEGRRDHVCAAKATDGKSQKRRACPHGRIEGETNVDWRIYGSRKVAEDWYPSSAQSRHLIRCSKAKPGTIDKACPKST